MPSKGANGRGEQHAHNSEVFGGTRRDRRCGSERPECRLSSRSLLRRAGFRCRHRRSVLLWWRSILRLQPAVWLWIWIRIWAPLVSAPVSPLAPLLTLKETGERDQDVWSRSSFFQV